MPANRIGRLAEGQHTGAEHRRHWGVAVHLTQQGFDAEPTELGAGRGHRGQRRIAHRRHVDRAQDRHEGGLATAMLASIPAIILLVIAQKYIAAGATGGAVK